MALKTPNATSAQPGKPAMQDDTVAAPAVEHAEPDAGTEWDTGAASAGSPPATTQGGQMAPHDPNNKFASVEGKLGFGSFPQVKLDKDIFYIGEEGKIKGEDGFLFHPMQSKSRWIVKAGKKDFVFSYDNPKEPGARANDGKPISAHISEWRADGKLQNGQHPEIREYQELYGRILDGEFKGRMVILSLPPTSIARVSGVFAEAQAFKHLTPDQLVLRISKGELITTKAGETYYPWNFRAHSSMAEWQQKEDEAGAESEAGE